MIKPPSIELMRLLGTTREIRRSFHFTFTWEPKQVTPAAIEWLWWVFVLPYDGQ